jgi:UDP-N-acetylglucosamine 2-epimerase
MPNADHNSKIIYDEINSFVKKNKNSIAFKSLGSLKYLSCLKLCNVVLGNSSSGLLEAPNLKIPTINIGDRQKGRAKSGSVVDCLPTQKKIYLNLTSILSGKKKFKNKDFFSPYGQGGASKKILKILEKVNYKNLLKKKFINIVRT